MCMSATPRSARLSKPGEVVAILVASAAVWIALVGIVVTLVFTVLIPTALYSGKGEIPGNFPVYPGAHLDSAVASYATDCTIVNAVWSTSAGVSTVTAFYQGALAAEPWSVTTTASSNGAFRIYFRTTSGLNREGTLGIESRPYVNPPTHISLELYKSGPHAEYCDVGPTPVAVRRPN
jgi:hypothetical protein